MSEAEDSGGILDMAKRVTGVSMFQDGDKVGVERTVEVEANDDVMGAPVAESVKSAREQVQQNEHDTAFDLYDALLDLDPELSGAVNAISQSAANFEVILPEDDPDDTEQDILDECLDLTQRIRGQTMSIDVLRNLIAYGNDFNKKIYNANDGIVSVQSLPVKSMTIVDDRDTIGNEFNSDDDDIPDFLKNVHPDISEDPEDLDDSEQLEEVFSRDAYVLNETAEETDHSLIEPHDTLHFYIDARSNWFEDPAGRQTYGVWGRSRLEPLTFTIQTKYNTLTNKVAMDDKLLAREIYYIDTTTLFGDIPDPEERKKKAENYAGELKSMIEELEADERPMLPDHVEVDVIGPEGKAIDQTPFVEQLNNSIAASLTFPMAGLGRGTTSVKAGEEISSLWAENNIRNLRTAVIRGFEELFRDHTKLLFEDVVENHDSATDLGEMEIDPDVTIPTLEYEPFREEDRTELVDQIETLVNIGVMSISEARDRYGLPTDDESMNDLREELSNLGPAVGSPSDGQGGDQDAE